MLQICDVQPLAASYLFATIDRHVSKLDKEELSRHSAKMMTFFLHSMKFRTDHFEVCSIS